MIKILLGIFFLISCLIVFYIYFNRKKKTFIILKGTKTFDGSKKIVVPIVEDFENRTQLNLEFESKTDNLPLSLVGPDYMNVISQGDSFNIIYVPENGAYLFKIFHSNTKVGNVSLLTLENVPNQNWNKIKITIEGKRTLIYLNNKLKIAEILPGVPLLKDRDIVLGSDINGFKGYLKNVKYIT